MKLSIVTTLYKSAPYIDKFYERISDEARNITDDYEIIFVNDGSPDNSLEKVVKIHKKDDLVTVVDLSRNFGHHQAIMSGLAYANGDNIFLIDCDLEEDPKLLNTFWKELKKNPDLDMLYGVQSKRKGGRFESWSGHLFWKLFNYLAITVIKQNQSTVRIMRKRYVQSLLLFSENELFLAGLMTDVGYKQASFEITKQNTSNSTYNFRKKLALFETAMTSYTAKPLHMIFHLGVFISLFAIIYSIYLILGTIFFEERVPGWTSVIVSVWLLGGIILFSIGLVGIYLAKVFNEVKHRPRVIVKKTYKREQND